MRDLLFINFEDWDHLNNVHETDVTGPNFSGAKSEDKSQANNIVTLSEPNDTESLIAVIDDFSRLCQNWRLQKMEIAKKLKYVYLVLFSVSKEFIFVLFSKSFLFIFREL